MKYKKTLEDLEGVAVKWWPAEIAAEVSAITSLPILLATQDKFLAILKLAGGRPDQILDVVAASDLPVNIVLKHLIVLSDFGGEPIKRLGAEFKRLFPAKEGASTHFMDFTFNGECHQYEFRKLPIKGLSNAKLAIDGAKLAKATELDDLACDMIMLITHGATSSARDFAALDKCEIGGLLGKAEEIDLFVRQRYLSVSRIMAGADANSLGQFTQIHVASYLERKLGSDYSVVSNGRVNLRSYDSVKGMPFDVVVERGKKVVGIEVSFQVTSNSVIERKAASAEDRKTHMGREGHFVAYVLDGAGNFSRRAAMTAICQSSDCTVAFSDSELDTLADFIKGRLDDPLR